MTAEAMPHDAPARQPRRAQRAWCERAAPARANTGRIALWMLAGLTLVATGLVAAVLALNLRGDTEPPAPQARPVDPSDRALVERGATLARAGNCAACHTARGGTPYAGGRPVDTPFGTVYAPNLTPDAATGLGRWTPADLRRALHLGRSRDGRLLVPACPYPQLTAMTRADTDALWAFLRSLPATDSPAQPHALRFPYGSQASLAVWRALYFRPVRWQDDPGRPADWNRGRYLVQGVAHCAACHATRGPLGGADALDLHGGRMPGRGWHAPSLHDPRAGGVADWTVEEVVALLRDGVNRHASVAGPMADVVWHGTRHLPPADLRAMATYLRTLPAASRPAPPAPTVPAEDREQGARLYARHCADCHGERGEGRPGEWPGLAGNRAVQLADPANVIQAIRRGGFAPATPGNPRPAGMPPFGWLLDDDDIAAVATHVRQSWGNQGAAVSRLDVVQAR